MTYTIAFLDPEIGDTIAVYSNCSDYAIIRILMDITYLPDLYDGMSVNEACELIKYEVESGGLRGLSLTIIDSDNATIFCEI